MRTLSPNEATDETGLVTPAGTTFPPGCRRRGIAPGRDRGNAGVAGRISPLAAHRAAGAGHTIIEGGTGGSGPVPVTALVAYRASSSGGDVGCLALAAPRPAGSRSGAFTSNVMYVTGRVPSLSVTGRSAVFRGRATVTGLGAGHDRPFTVKAGAGGPGATVLLTVCGLTFHEILTDGHFDVS